MTVRAQQVVVTLAAVLWIGGTLVGTGVVAGGGVESQGGGLFSDSATLIAPQGPAFSIWSVIYLGLAGYVVWQWLPPVADSRWARATRLPAAAAIALNGLWLLVVFAGWVWLSVVVMLGIVVSLGLVLRATSGLPRQGLGADVWVSATFGLYLAGSAWPPAPTSRPGWWVSAWTRTARPPPGSPSGCWPSSWSWLSGC
ncbi:hypothetical protein [Serinicoccus sp. CNJ-927]|uniref:hypothetical protein n=1 Tax=Serinicoccus sp. CNJ-927 TaxID=1904970 RepID=UPI0009FAB005|nr:hypothetical protein [Serinicoccus sp. CNJ-927]